MTEHPADRPAFERDARPLAGPDDGYVAFLGDAAAFGRGGQAGLAQLVAEALQAEVLDLCVEGAGPRFYLDDIALLSRAAGARVCVVHAMCASAISNRMFAVRPRGNQRLTGVSDLLAGIYPDVPFGRFSSVRTMLRHLHRLDPARFRLVRDEMRSAWVGRMDSLLRGIDAPTVLLWCAGHAPGTVPTGPEEAWRAPLFVDRAMLEAVRPAADAYAEAVAPDDVSTNSGLLRPTGKVIDRERSGAAQRRCQLAAQSVLPELRRLGTRTQVL